jgi:hypothetical protein
MSLLFLSRFCPKGSEYLHLTLLLAIYAGVLSTLNIILPRYMEWRERREAIFRALQEDRKAIALVTIRVIDGSWDSRLRRRESFRAKLLRSLGVAVGLEGSDRGKAYVLAALKHIVQLDNGAYRQEVRKELKTVEEIFEAYANTGADADFKDKRLVPLQAIIEAVQTERKKEPM